MSKIRYHKQRVNDRQAVHIKKRKKYNKIKGVKETKAAGRKG